MNDAPIGIFDSGIGGLTVARAIYARLPHESTIYFGDTARVPYGPKSPETVVRYSREILHWLLEERVKAIVVACNTVTAHALPTLADESPVPIIGVIDPGARAAVRAAQGGTIGVIGTAGTIASHAYAQAIAKRGPGVPVVERACPLFVPLVEEGWFEHEATALVAEEYLTPLRDAGVRALVLGCTHYPLLKPLLQRVMGPDVTLIDSADETAAVLAATLERSGLAVGPLAADAPATHRFAVSDDEPRFLAVGARFIGARLDRAERVSVEGR